MTRPRGRPRKSDDQGTRDRLLEAATDACVEEGFESVTLSGIARRADVTPAAVYNHFADRDALLYTAGRAAIERLGATAAPVDGPARGAHEVVDAFLDPSFATSRRLILELHLAGQHHPELATHLAAWHREFADLALVGDPDDAPDRLAEVKALFVLLLGACHVDDLGAIDVDPSLVSARLHAMVDALYG